MSRQPIFTVEQFMESFKLWATAYMLKAFVEQKAKDDGITPREAADKITDVWYQAQLDGFNAELNKMSAGEFRLMQARAKVSDLEDLRVEFRRVLETANAEVMKMLVDTEKKEGAA